MADKGHQDKKIKILNINESKGYSSSKLDTLKEFLDKSGTSSMIILIEGDLIYEYGNTTKKHLIHSIRKCLLNSLFGIAVEQGKIDRSMTLKELGLQDEPLLSDFEQNASIADLLKSKSGIYHPSAAMSQEMINCLPKRNSNNIGENYYYNNKDLFLIFPYSIVQHYKNIEKNENI